MVKECDRRRRGNSSLLAAGSQTRRAARVRLSGGSSLTELAPDLAHGSRLDLDRHGSHSRWRDWLRHLRAWPPADAWCDERGLSDHRAVPRSSRALALLAVGTKRGRHSPDDGHGPRGTQRCREAALGYDRPPAVA